MTLHVLTSNAADDFAVHHSTRTPYGLECALARNFSIGMEYRTKHGMEYGTMWTNPQIVT